MQAGDLVGLAFAGAAGFAVCKLLEADAHGVPWQLALKNPHRSVMLLRAKLDTGNPEALEGLSGWFSKKKAKPISAGTAAGLRAFGGLKVVGKGKVSPGQMMANPFRKRLGFSTQSNPFAAAFRRV